MVILSQVVLHLLQLHLKVDNVKAFRIMELILPVLLFVMNVSLLAVLWFGAKEIQTGDVELGELVAIINYAMRMTGAFSMFAFIIIFFSRAKASSERMEEVLMVEEGIEILMKTLRWDDSGNRGN